jgi:hypothetical protein
MYHGSHPATVPGTTVMNMAARIHTGTRVVSSAVTAWMR